MGNKQNKTKQKKKTKQGMMRFKKALFTEKKCK